LNSRPLAPLDSAPAYGIQALTHGHFLVGKPLQALPTPDLRQKKISFHFMTMESLPKTFRRRMGEIESGLLAAVATLCQVNATTHVSAGRRHCPAKRHGTIYEILATGRNSRDSFRRRWPR